MEGSESKYTGCDWQATKKKENCSSHLLGFLQCLGKAWCTERALQWRRGNYIFFCRRLKVRRTCWSSRHCHRSPSRPLLQPAGRLSSWRPAWDPLVGSDLPPPSFQCPFPGEWITAQRKHVYLPRSKLQPIVSTLPAPRETYQFVLLAACLALFLGQLSHFFFHVPYLPLHSLILLLLPVFCSDALVPLLCHLFQVLLQTTHQALRKDQGEISERWQQDTYLIVINLWNIKNFVKRLLWFASFVQPTVQNPQTSFTIICDKETGALFIFKKLEPSSLRPFLLIT